MLNKHLEAILAEMFNRVGETFNEEYVKPVGWWLNHTWTAAGEDDFKGWLIQYGRKKNRYSKKQAERFANEFLLCYGWKNEEKND